MTSININLVPDMVFLKYICSVAFYEIFEQEW